MTYYTPLIILVWLALTVLIILTKENDRLKKDKKNIQYITYLLVAVAALSEWLGIQMSGNTAVSPWLLRTVKLFDYILTPIAGGAIVLQFQTKSIWNKLLFSFLAANTLFQIVSFFTGWMIAIDAENRYSHRPEYYVYVAFYLIIIIIVIIEFATYGKKFRKQNIISLYASLIFLLTGIMMQEILGGEVRTAYISLTVCLALLFIHNSEFAQLESDDQIYEQMVRISEDPLTGLLSRYAYTSTVQEMSSLESLPQDLVVFLIDINGLKNTNDTFGHNAGDELIRGAAECISSVFGAVGKCYRTGGDEFIVFANTDKVTATNLTAQLNQTTQKWHGKEAPSLSLSIGFAEAVAHPGITAEKLVAAADCEMYKAKTEYYNNNRIERRKNM